MRFPAPSPVTDPVRVAVTGAGMITALGATWAENAAGFRAGRRAFREVGVFDASRQRVRTAAEVTLPASPPATRLGRRRAARLDRAAQMLLHAAAEAWDAAGGPVGDPLPLALGTTSAGMMLGEAFHRQVLAGGGRRGQAARIAHYQAQAQGADLQAAFGFTGPVTIIANACASGANAVGHAFRLVRDGHAPRVLAGGYDALSGLVFAGFDALQALSPDVCRPFDARRNGLALGEGAAVFLLEALPAAERRGARVLGEVLGYGAATDIHHLTQPHPAGEAALTTMSAACAQAGVVPAEIGYVNAHGTGTPLNDAAEAAALARWAGDAAGGLAMSSTKAGIGHLLGAAGAVEFGVCLMALGGGWRPPMLTTGEPDPACPCRLVRAPEDAPLRRALTNSFGFGGANASLVVARAA